MRHTTSLFATGVVALGLMAVAAATAANQEATYDPPVALDIVFVFHIDEDIPEQDVFVDRGDGMVGRPTRGERDLSQPLYATARPVEHSPFEPDDLGPWPMGRPLGITLADWFAAEGRGRYSCVDGAGHLEVTFTNLVPNGVYTMWHDFYAWPPTEPFIGTYDLPIGARDGSESVFQTDAGGNAVVVRDFKPCLQLSGEHLAAELAIAWHSDRNTYGPIPGEFGNRTHVHMYAGLPKRTGL